MPRFLWSCLTSDTTLFTICHPSPITILCCHNMKSITYLKSQSNILLLLLFLGGGYFTDVMKSCQFGNLTSQVPQVHCIQYYQSRGWGPWLELNKKQAGHLESFVLYFAFDPGEDLARRHPVRADRHRAQCSRPWAKGWRPVQVKIFHT